MATDDMSSNVEGPCILFELEHSVELRRGRQPLPYKAVAGGRGVAGGGRSTSVVADKDDPYRACGEAVVASIAGVLRDLRFPRCSFLVNRRVVRPEDWKASTAAFPALHEIPECKSVSTEDGQARTPVAPSEAPTSPPCEARLRHHVNARYPRPGSFEVSAYDVGRSVRRVLFSKYHERVLPKEPKDILDHLFPFLFIFAGYANEEELIIRIADLALMRQITLQLPLEELQLHKGLAAPLDVIRESLEDLREISSRGDPCEIGMAIESIPYGLRTTEVVEVESRRSLLVAIEDKIMEAISKLEAGHVSAGWQLLQTAVDTATHAGLTGEVMERGLEFLAAGGEPRLLDADTGGHEAFDSEGSLIGHTQGTHAIGDGRSDGAASPVKLSGPEDINNQDLVNSRSASKQLDSTESMLPPRPASTASGQWLRTSAPTSPPRANSCQPDSVQRVSSRNSILALAKPKSPGANETSLQELSELRDYLSKAASDLPVPIDTTKINEPQGVRKCVEELVGSIGTPSPQNEAVDRIALPHVKGQEELVGSTGAPSPDKKPADRIALPDVKGQEELVRSTGAPSPDKKPVDLIALPDVKGQEDKVADRIAASDMKVQEVAGTEKVVGVQGLRSTRDVAHQPAERPRPNQEQPVRAVLWHARGPSRFAATEAVDYSWGRQSPTSATDAYISRLSEQVIVLKASNPEDAARSLSTVLGDTVRVCVLLGSLLCVDSKALLKATAIKLGALGDQFSFILCGRAAPQKLFAESCGDSSRVWSLLSGMPLPADVIGAGQKVYTCMETAQCEEVFHRCGHIYITFEGGPSMAKEAQAVLACHGANGSNKTARGPQGAAVPVLVPLVRTGGASAGLYDFPKSALDRPRFASPDKWSLLAQQDAQIADSASAVASILEEFIAAPRSAEPEIEPITASDEQLLRDVDEEESTAQDTLSDTRGTASPPKRNVLSATTRSTPLLAAQNCPSAAARDAPSIADQDGPPAAIQSAPLPEADNAPSATTQTAPPLDAQNVRSDETVKAPPVSLPAAQGAPAVGTQAIPFAATQGSPVDEERDVPPTQVLQNTPAAWPQDSTAGEGAPVNEERDVPPAQELQDMPAAWPQDTPGTAGVAVPSAEVQSTLPVTAQDEVSGTASGISPGAAQDAPSTGMQETPLITSSVAPSGVVQTAPLAALSSAPSPIPQGILPTAWAQDAPAASVAQGTPPAAPPNAPAAVVQDVPPAASPDAYSSYLAQDVPKAPAASVAQFPSPAAPQNEPAAVSQNTSLAAPSPLAQAAPTPTSTQDAPTAVAQFSSPAAPPSESAAVSQNTPLAVASSSPAQPVPTTTSAQEAPVAAAQFTSPDVPSNAPAAVTQNIPVAVPAQVVPTTTAAQDVPVAAAQFTSSDAPSNAPAAVTQSIPVAVPAQAVPITPAAVSQNTPEALPSSPAAQAVPTTTSAQDVPVAAVQFTSPTPPIAPVAVSQNTPEAVPSSSPAQAVPTTTSAHDVPVAAAQFTSPAAPSNAPVAVSQNTPEAVPSSSPAQAVPTTTSAQGVPVAAAQFTSPAAPSNAPAAVVQSIPQVAPGASSSSSSSARDLPAGVAGFTSPAATLGAPSSLAQSATSASAQEIPVNAAQYSPLPASSFVPTAEQQGGPSASTSGTRVTPMQVPFAQPTPGSIAALAVSLLEALKLAVLTGELEKVARYCVLADVMPARAGQDDAARRIQTAQRGKAGRRAAARRKAERRARTAVAAQESEKIQDKPNAESEEVTQEDQNAATRIQAEQGGKRDRAEAAVRKREAGKKAAAARREAEEEERRQVALAAAARKREAAEKAAAERAQEAAEENERRAAIARRREAAAKAAAEKAREAAEEKALAAQKEKEAIARRRERIAAESRAEREARTAQRERHAREEEVNAKAADLSSVRRQSDECRQTKAEVARKTEAAAEEVTPPGSRATQSERAAPLADEDWQIRKAWPNEAESKVAVSPAKSVAQNDAADQEERQRAKQQDTERVEKPWELTPEAELNDEAILDEAERLADVRESDTCSTPSEADREARRVPPGAWLVPEESLVLRAERPEMLDAALKVAECPGVPFPGRPRSSSEPPPPLM